MIGYLHAYSGSVACRWDKNVLFDQKNDRSKGSHGTLHYGSQKTTLKDLRQEIGAGLLAAMLAQLGLSRRDLDE